MAVPFFDIHYGLDEAAQSELLGRWQRILQHGQFVNGPEVRELEAALAEALGLPHVVGCSNGSDALVLALRAAGIGAGDEVLVPAFTFFASAGSVVRVGATPVFCDVDPHSLLIDTCDAAARVTTRTRAVMPVHLYGLPCDASALGRALEAAAGRPIAVIEDAAQAIGATHPSGAVGGMGVAAAWSCFPTKNLGATGDAGFASCSDPEVAARIMRLREHGGGLQYHHDEVGYNFRMDSVQAAGLLMQLPRLEEFNAARRVGADHYRALFAAAGLENVLQLPAEHPGHVYHQFVVHVTGGRRDALAAALRERGIGTAIYYPLALHLQPCFAELGGTPGQLPNAERATAEVLALPIHPGVTAAQREEVVAGFVACLAEAPAEAGHEAQA